MQADEESAKAPNVALIIMSWDISLHGLAVLVVDDHADGRELTAEVLTSAGANVTTACSGREAIALLGSAWDVVVTDISMPDGTGYDLIREARLNECRVPMIALTALNTPEHRQRITSSGFACLLIKPLFPERLIAAVWEVVHAPGATPPRISPARKTSGADETDQVNPVLLNHPSQRHGDSTS